MNFRINPKATDIQVLKTEAGEELVVLTRRAYDVLRAKAGDEAAEDAATAIVVDQALADLAEGREAALPESVWERIEAGENSILVLREHRGLSQRQVAESARLAQAFVSKLERGESGGSVRTYRSIAKALGVPLSMVVGEKFAKRFDEDQQDADAFRAKQRAAFEARKAERAARTSEGAGR